jgi:uroporphyrinogen-III synthase
MSRLSGRVVATTRDGAPDDPLTEKLRAEGAKVLEWPTLSFEAPYDAGPLERARRDMQAGAYDWVVVTSARAVEPLGRGEDVPKSVRVAAVGAATAAALRARGWRVDVTGTSDASALVEAVSEGGATDGARVLFPAGSLAGDTIEKGMAALGARVERVEAYRTVPRSPGRLRVREDLRRGVDAVAFASPSAVGALVETLSPEWPAALGRAGLAAIGPSTTRKLTESGVDEGRIATADPPGLDGLVDACVSCIEQGKGVPS